MRYVLKFNRAENFYFIFDALDEKLVLRADARPRTFVTLAHARRALAKLNQEG